jgi:hypothetical protein
VRKEEKMVERRNAKMIDTSPKNTSLSPIILLSELTFKQENAIELSKNLVKHLEETGLNVLSKNDFYDFILYLLDKYSNEHFLSTYSNQKNALLLKVKPEKIKASKLNIFLKYVKQDEQKRALSSLIPKILNEEIIIKDHIKEKSMQLTIEDSVLRFCLDGKMKTELGISPDTSFNNEILVIDKIDFFKILLLIAKDDDTLFKEHEELLKLINTSKMEENAKEAFTFLIEGTLELAGNLIPVLPTETIKKGLHICFDKAVKMLSKRK